MNFARPKLMQEYETLRNEFTICRRKLDSKCEALLILTKDLDVSRQERDQFKLMAEQVQARYQGLKRQLSGVGPRQPPLDGAEFSGMKQQNLAHLMCEMREVNKAQQFEVDDLKQKLADARGDIKLLREQIARHRVGTTDEGINTRHFPAHEREDLVKQLEEAREQYVQIERDLQQVLDEKEELVTERDVYKNKYDRLNSELNLILKGDEKRIVDIDALSMENKYLQDRINQMEEEKGMAMATVSKYKSILERKKNKGIIRLGQSRAGGVVVSQKQVQQLLENKSVMTPTPKMMADLQSLATALLETLNDKNTALSHQRKTNKILGTRVSELEKKLKTLEVAGLWNIPDKANSLEKLKLEVQEIQTLIPTSPPLTPQGEPHQSASDILASLASDAKAALTNQKLCDVISDRPRQHGLPLSLHDLDFLPTKEGATGLDTGCVDTSGHMTLLQPMDILETPQTDLQNGHHGDTDCTRQESQPVSDDESTAEDYTVEELGALLGKATAKVTGQDQLDTDPGLDTKDDPDNALCLTSGFCVEVQEGLLNGQHGQMDLEGITWNRDVLANGEAGNQLNLPTDQDTTDQTSEINDPLKQGLNGLNFESGKDLTLGLTDLELGSVSPDIESSPIHEESSKEGPAIESEEPSSVSTSPRCTSPLLDSTEVHQL